MVPLVTQPDLKVTKTVDFRRAVAALKHGDAIVFPTETLYGLGADALDGDAVARVFQLKGRDRQNPIPVLVADEGMLLSLVREIPSTARKLMHRFWPGPLTLVMPARPGVPPALVNHDGGIGVRISSQPIATQLVQALGRPLTATSANPSGQEPARTVEQAAQYFGRQIELFVDAGPLASRTGSTVVQVLGATLKVIRDGEISAAQLQEVLDREEVSR